MGLLLVLVSTHISMQALPSSIEGERARIDLGRSLVQTAFVCIYLVAIIACRPYVPSIINYQRVWFINELTPFKNETVNIVTILV